MGNKSRDIDIICKHSIGWNPYEHNLLEIGMCLNDEITNIPFNYCPW